MLICFCKASTFKPEKGGKDEPYIEYELVAENAEDGWQLARFHHKDNMHSRLITSSPPTVRVRLLTKHDALLGFTTKHLPPDDNTQDNLPDQLQQNKSQAGS